MSSIQPSGNIWLLSGVPLDRTYQNTIYWPLPGSATNRILQREYFVGANSDFVKRRFTNQMYSRHTAGVVRVEAEADEIFDCNYMAFQNINFGGDKIFYAFITRIEYVNNRVSNVYFEIDVLQTWYFDYDLATCYVERMHSVSDNVGDNIVPEPVPAGEYFYSQLFDDFAFTGALVVIMAIVSTSESSSGNRYGNIYGGTTLYAFSPTDVTGINAKIASYIISPESIVSMYMAPRMLLRDGLTIPDGGVELASGDVKTGTWHLQDSTIPQRNTGALFGEYLPHNKKLYTYPYTALEVATPQGGRAVYRYEFFPNGTPSFNYGGSLIQPTELKLIPAGYKGTDAESSSDSLRESLSLQGYPMCSWNTDAFKAWVAQNSIPIGIQAVANSAIAGLAATAMPFNLGMIMSMPSVIRDVSNTLQQSYRASIAADQLHGQTNGSAAVSMNVQCFYFGRIQVNESSARLIDAFFDRFGYAVKRLVEPSRKNRRFFTYIKTIGCVVHGGIPADDEEKICQIHDNGITYWDVSALSGTAYTVGDFGCAYINTPTA